MTLEEISHHIYGLKESEVREDRPHFFVKELELYMNYFKEKLDESATSFNKKQEKYFQKFLDNMNDGVNYYTNLFEDMKLNFFKKGDLILESIKKQKIHLEEISKKIALLKSELE